jgi:hypothetical protein
LSLEVAVFHKKPDEVLSIVKELKAHGLTQGKDFDFAYHKSKYDYHWQYEIEPNRAIFTFYTERYATLFALKYS